MRETRLRSCGCVCGPALALVLGLAAPGCWLGDDGSSATVGDTEATTSASASTSAATSGVATGVTDATGATGATSSPETSGSPEPCDGPESCPSVLCRQALCVGGGCEYQALAAGTLIDDAVGDCRVTQCDGLGGGQEVADDDPPEDTIGDCKRATCEAGQVAYLADDIDLPSDDLECTVDTCDAGTPAFTAKPVNTFCGPMGSYFCHADAECRACKVIDVCDDPGPEPNELQAVATDLGAVGDADSQGGFVCGALDGQADVDWYVYVGDDTVFGAVDPTRALEGTAGARLCVYAECLKGGTSISCGGLTPDTAPLGQAGCCGSGEVAPSLECGGLDDSARVWIRVDAPEDACVPYQLDYHY